MSNWHLPHVSREFWAKRGSSEYNPFEPMAAGIGYHSPTPQYEGEAPRSESCEYLNGKPCYSDYSVSASEPVLLGLIAKGDEAVWAALEEWYAERFQDGGR